MRPRSGELNQRRVVKALEHRAACNPADGWTDQLTSTRKLRTDHNRGCGEGVKVSAITGHHRNVEEAKSYLTGVVNPFLSMTWRRSPRSSITSTSFPRFESYRYDQSASS